MRMYTFLRRLLDVPIALAALAALTIAWRMRANRAEQERRPHAGVR
jgi:hypothetical protein